MAKLSDVSSKFFCLIIFVISFECINASLKKKKQDDFPNFDQIKNDLFFDTHSNVLNKSSEYSYQNGVELLQCLNELNSIKNGLINSEQWATRIVDAWGKMPSGILNGNLYDLGAFSQCLHIERNEEVYRTQYCMAHVIFDLEDFISAPISFEYTLSHMNVPKVMSTAQPEFGHEPGVILGTCFPASCSVDALDIIINEVIRGKMTDVSVKISKNSCQFEEYPSKLRKIDKAMITLLGVISCLILLSTGYDILYSVINREKSRVLLVFSLYTNGMELISIQKIQSPNAMACMNGIRAISTQWIVLGHTYLMYLWLPVSNKSDIQKVDNFFTLSGLLVSIKMLKYFERKERLNLLQLYLHRFIRLTPLLGASFLFSMSLMRFFGSGPFWPTMLHFFHGECERYWWSTLLYIQNFVNQNDMCFRHSWSLSLDMQLYLLAPAIIYSVYRYKAKALYILSALVLCCIGCTLMVHLKYGFTTMFSKGKLEKAYYALHIRYSPWMVGVIAGYFFFIAEKKPFRITKMLNLFAWTLSLASMFIIIFGSYQFQQLDSKLSPFDFGLFEGLSRVIWACSLCFIIFACCHGYGGPVNWFLAHPFFQLISRLSYSVYLLHLPVIWLTMASMKSPLYFSEVNAAHAFFGNYIISIFVSIVATLAFERPVLMIEKLLSRKVAEPQLDVDTKDKQNGSERNGTKPNGCKQNRFKPNQTEILIKLLKKHNE
ncbi:O-acyltransferase like protein-like isoform X2 [Sitodiplosis mosellana]|uniref:O-acyltransferase like protein-like isoform X2 n=1 Tax=Sitodiplosis mosellana TaxID=263140 RepID=UPI002443AB40|nr:O-acyltransferase like protein-like isoform X2 [Sitodiplosis mosellana]